MKRTLKQQISWVVIFSFFMATLPLAIPAQNELGNLRGFVYGDDGQTPLKDALVLIRDTKAQQTFVSEKTSNSGSYEIKKIIPAVYAVGIQYKGQDYNVDVLLEIKPEKQMACFTLPKKIEKPGYQIRCKSPKCFFITPCGWALVAGVTAGVTFTIIKITEKEASPTT